MSMYIEKEIATLGWQCNAMNYHVMDEFHSPAIDLHDRQRKKEKMQKGKAIPALLRQKFEPSRLMKSDCSSRQLYICLTKLCKLMHLQEQT